MNQTSYQPLVSIIINNYNYANFVENSIRSAISQTYSNFEIIVVDDGSTDESREIISTYKDQIIPIYKSNNGQASAFNAGFQASHGDIICFLDSDDIFEPQKVEEIVRVFKLYPSVGWCFHPLNYFDTKTGEILVSYPPAPKNSQREIDFRDEINKKAKIPSWGPATSGLCFRRSLIQKILPMPEQIKISSDYYLRYAAISLSKGFFIDNPLAVLRVHDKNNWTLQSNLFASKFQIFLLTGYWLRQNFPALKRMANKNFSWGMGIQWWIGKPDPEIKSQVISPYLDSLSQLEKFEVRIRASIRWFKTAWKQRKLSYLPLIKPNNSNN